MFQLVTESHQIPNSMSDLSTVAESSTVACQRRWCGSLAVQEAAMYRILLIAVLGLSLGACVPYSDGETSYYSSEVYSSPAPAYYAGGSSYYSNGGGYYTPPARYYAPPARYYQPTPRYYHQPRVYQPEPRYYQPAPRYYQSRPDYRSYQNHGWDGRNRGGWNNDYRGNGGRNNNHGGRGDHNGRGDHVPRQVRQGCRPPRPCGNAPPPPHPARY
jgi:hypothetical protein